MPCYPSAALGLSARSSSRDSHALTSIYSPDHLFPARSLPVDLSTIEQVELNRSLGGAGSQYKIRGCSGTHIRLESVAISLGRNVITCRTPLHDVP